MNRPVAITWSLLLAGSYALVVPTLVTLLGQTLAAARHIEGYTAEILEHAAGIDRNTAQAAGLKETIVVAPRLVAAAESLQRHTDGIVTTLGSNGDGALPDQEVEP